MIANATSHLKSIFRAILTGTVAMTLALSPAHASRGSENYESPTEIQAGAGDRSGSTTYGNHGILSSSAGNASSASYGHATGYFPQTEEEPDLEPTPPAHGTMAMNPEGPLEPGASIHVSFRDWLDDQLPLRYQVFVGNVPLSDPDTDAGLHFTGPTTPGNYALKGRIYDADGTYVEVEIPFTVSSPQESWRTEHFGIASNTGVAADNFDADQDGHANLLEWALLLDPQESNGGVLSQSTSEDGELQVHYSRSKAARAAGVAFFVEWSDSLVAEDWHRTSVTEAVVQENELLEWIRATMPPSTSGRRFARLQVTAPPP
jgi:hypothetical protein